MIRKKRILLIAIALLTLCLGQSEARETYGVKSATNDSVTFLVGGTNALYTKVINLQHDDWDQQIGVMYKAVSPGTVGINLYFEQSYTVPSVEGAADSSYIATHTIATSINDTNWHIATIDSVTQPWGRFRVNGVGSNSTGTTFRIQIAR